MSTRATIRFFKISTIPEEKEKFGPYLYHHFDGNPSNILNKIKDVWKIVKNSSYYKERFMVNFAKNPAINMQFFIINNYCQERKLFDIEIIPGDIQMKWISYNYNIFCDGSTWDIEIENNNKTVKLNVEEINDDKIKEIGSVLNGK
jgi:hypothetical protein